MLMHLYRTLASLKLAVILIVGLAAVLAVATFLEADKGREYAQWYVYDNPWFLGLLAMLAVNVLAAALIRLPWKRHQTGFVVTHAGLLVLLAGSVQTFLGGTDGQVALQEGSQTDKLLVTDRSVIRATRQTKRGPVATEFSLHPGPVDWPLGKELDFGVVDHFGLKILKFYRHARERTDWIADPLDYDGAALRLSLIGPGGQSVAEDWLAANRFGGQIVLGPTRFELLPIPTESMLQDFLNPPSGDMGQGGILSVHHEGELQRIRIDDSVGKKISVGESEIAVEIVEYLPNARPTAQGTFVSRGQRPDNPLLELRVHLPDAEEPIRQIAFAKHPLLNLDGVHGVESPVQFWYHHPDVTAVSGAMFLQTPDGRLYCRAVVKGALQPAGEVKRGDRVTLGGQFSVLLSQHIPRARKEVTFTPIELAPGASSGPEAAALVEVTNHGAKRQLWLKRQDERYGTQSLLTPQGPVLLSFGYDEIPLGFHVKLEEFTRRLNPGRVGDAAFASSVRLVDAARAIDQSHEISMNQPLVYGKFTFYQSSFQELPGGKEVSVLTAAHDPGRRLKYLGSLMICGGIFIMFYMRSYMFQSVPRLRVRKGRPPVGSDPDGSHQPSPDTLPKAA